LRRFIPRFARTSVRRLLATPIWLQGDLRDLPPLSRDIHPLRIREMDPSDGADLDAWAEIQSEAFGWRFARADAERLLLEHSLLDVRHTYLLVDSGEPIGAVSGAVFRERPEIGCGHMAGLRRRYHGRGLGRHLALYRYHALSAEGLRACETETRLQHDRSVLNHIRFGFRPKTRLDPWNGPDPAGPGLRRLADAALRARYAYARRISGAIERS